MALLVAAAPSRVPRSVMTPPLSMKACEAPLARSADPVTVPEVFMAVAADASPPSVPRLVITPPL
jgi:hypothetical protein